MLNEDDIADAIWCAREVIRTLNRTGAPIPQSLTLHLAKMQTALRASSNGSDICENASSEPPLVLTAQQLADRLGVTARAVRQRAEHHGGRRIGGRYLFPTPRRTHADE